MTHLAHCSCGAAEVQIHGEPLLRGFCHCTICQEFNQAPFGDVTFYRAKDVALPAEGVVAYKSYSQSNMVQRGRCTHCEQPIAETVQLRPFEALVVVPTQTMSAQHQKPEADMHIFYHRRVRDIDDALPKYSSFWSSQIAFGSQLMWRLIRRRLSS